VVDFTREVVHLSRKMGGRKLPRLRKDARHNQLMRADRRNGAASVKIDAGRGEPQKAHGGPSPP
jgi:hypothetical protein